MSLKPQLRPGRDLLLPSDREVVAEQLRAAARLIEDGGPNDQAAWRLAEACQDFVGIVRAEGDKHVAGIDYPTGTGALLPQT